MDKDLPHPPPRHVPLSGVFNLVVVVVVGIERAPRFTGRSRFTLFSYAGPRSFANRPCTCR